MYMSQTSHEHTQSLLFRHTDRSICIHAYIHMCIFTYLKRVMSTPDLCFSGTQTDPCAYCTYSYMYIYIPQARHQHRRSPLFRYTNRSI